MAIYKPNVIDFEASGLGPPSYPIEVGVVLSNGKSYCSLIYPAVDWLYWDDEAELIHGIKRQTLFEYGKPIQQVASELNSFLLDKTVYSDGWVVDNPCLIALFSKSGIEPKFHLSALEWILKEPQMLVWAKIKMEVIKDLSLKRHRASSDAMIIQETFARTHTYLTRSLENK